MTRRHLYPIKRNGLWGFCAFEDGMIKNVIKPQFTAVGSFRDGFCPAASYSFWGCIKEDGSWQVEPHYDSVGPCSSGLMAIGIDDQVGFIDPEGRNKVSYVDRSCFATLEFHEGLIPFRRSSQRKWGYLSEDEQLCIPHRYSWAGDFQGGLAPVRDRSGWAGVINLLGHWVIKPGEFLQIGGLSEGKMVARRGHHAGFIDPRGEELIPFEYERAGSFKEGRARVEIFRDCWRFIDENANFTSDCYQGASDYSEGLALVRKTDGKSVFIDRDGQVVIAQGDWTTASSFVGDLARVEYENGFGYIDRNGNSVWRFTSTLQVSLQDVRLVKHAPGRIKTVAVPRQSGALDPDHWEPYGINEESIKAAESHGSQLSIHTDWEGLHELIVALQRLAMGGTDCVDFCFDDEQFKRLQIYLEDENSLFAGREDS